ncbi:type II toxin-antitoxin system VapC family toxin [Acidothermaceae bacterium B102]|nr:type II toxin-antitoxin system VapC family toxin [Acidothermaceae bacterium B102]
MIYLDSSALLKLLFQEAESDALELWLSARRDVPKVSSELAKVEVVRACRRLDPTTVPAAQRLLAQLDLIPLSGAVIEQACDVGGETLRSLDALHLASALTIGADLSAFVVYDHRLTACAVDAGLPTLRPGA